MDYFDRIAGEWYEQAPEVADRVMAHLVNRTDVWGRYTRRKSEQASRAVTVPVRDERGKVILDSDSLCKQGRRRVPFLLPPSAAGGIRPAAGCHPLCP